MSTDIQPRKPKGQPTGGEFDNKAQSDDNLGPLDESSRGLRQTPGKALDESWRLMDAYRRRSECAENYLSTVESDLDHDEAEIDRVKYLLVEDSEDIGFGVYNVCLRAFDRNGDELDYEFTATVSSLDVPGAFAAGEDGEPLPGELKMAADQAGGQPLPVVDMQALREYDFYGDATRTSLAVMEANLSALRDSGKVHGVPVTHDRAADVALHRDSGLSVGQAKMVADRVMKDEEGVREAMAPSVHALAELVDKHSGDVAAEVDSLRKRGAKK